MLGSTAEHAGLRSTVEAQLRKLKKDDDADEANVDYLVEVLLAEDGAEMADVHEMLNGIVERELTEEEFQEFWSSAASQDGVVAQAESERGVQALTADQLAQLHSLEEEQGANEASLALAAAEAAPAAPEVVKPKKERLSKEELRAKRRQERQDATNEQAKLKAAGEGEFSTKRFERFHKTWMGHDSWKLQDHALVETAEELDDDDYSSAWLECLRLGIPWGGRGAGGRGVQRVTGETKDVHIPNVTMARDGETLLHNATLKLNYGSRYCLTGRNGCGKTTLLRRIARGALPGFPPYLQVQYVEQELKGSELTPVEYVLRYDFERTRLMAEEQAILTKMESEEAVAAGVDDVVKLQERLNQVYERLEQISAWDAETRAEAKLREVGFSDELLAKPTDALSGGWRMRCALVGTLFMQPDLLLLDEPTNALDVLGVEWLTRYLGDRSNFAGTVLLVSHDRAFINAVTDELIVLRKKQFAYFPGTYNEYREMLQIHREGLQNKLAKQEKRKDELKSFIETQQRASRDRKSKGGDPKKQKQIRSRKKQIEMIDRIGLGRADGKYFRQSKDGWYGLPSALDFDEKPLSFRFPDALAVEPAGTPLIQLDRVSYGWSPGAPLVEAFSAQVRSGARIGVLGPNGVGKSTLLQVLQAQLAPLSGEILSVVTPGRRAIFHQDMATRLDQTKTAAELVLDLPRGPGTIDCQTVEDARSFLGAFGLTGNLALRPISTLSGGQKVRVVFALESYSRPELLILDEPTAHLDLDSIDVLGAALNSFNGTALLVSHDSAFLAETCDELWVFDPKTKSIRVCLPEADQTRQEFVAQQYAAFISRNFNFQAK